MNFFYLPLFLFSLIFAETSNIHSKVLDMSSNPISNVNIYSSNIGVFSDNDGLFTIEIDSEALITFSHIGYQEITLKANKIQDEVFLQTSFIPANKIIVTSGLDKTSLDRSVSSTTIFSRNLLKSNTKTHFDNLTHKIPNLISAGGTSRSRYFQIRGIGERSQYPGETTPNFSVGYVMDGIDFSGIGMMGFLFDVKQIEVFKGPQSSVYGPNALAGLISVNSMEPTPFLSGQLSSTVGSDNITRNALAIGWPLGPNLLFRIAGQVHRQDGFRHNTFFDVDTTNQRYEMFYRYKLHWLPNERVTFKINHFFGNIENGYDVWDPENDIDLQTHSNRPGVDKQISNATTLTANLQLRQLIGVDGMYRYVDARHDIEYSYDGDWGNDEFWLENYGFDNVAAGWSNDYFEETMRDRNANSHEFRVKTDKSKIFSMIVGAYSSSIKETDVASGYLFSGSVSDLQSAFDITNLAFYGQFLYKLNESTSMLLNLRNEHHVIDYNGNSNNDGEPLPEVDVNLSNNHFGGKLSVISIINTHSTLFTSISRGFKAGGVNQNPYLLTDALYSPEYNINFESGIRYNSNTLSADINLFYMMRTDQQVQMSSQQEDSDVLSFNYITANAGSGSNYGAEISLTKQLLNYINVRSAMGLLSTHIDEYSYEAEGGIVAMGNRNQAMAPAYNYSTTISYSHPIGFSTSIELMGKGQYYYSESHNEQSKAYNLINMETSYSKNSWTISFWAKNITDERYPIRGFYFGLIPPDYNPPSLYVQWGDPAHYGMTISYQF